MTLVDTSIWVEHFRHGNSHLQELLMEGFVFCHPYIIGELALGHLKNRQEILTLLKSLPQAEVALEDEVLGFIENKKLMGKGIGYLDVHLLISALLSELRFWTADKKLKKASQGLNVYYSG